MSKPIIKPVKLVPHAEYATLRDATDRVIAISPPNQYPDQFEVWANNAAYIVEVLNGEIPPILNDFALPLRVGFKYYSLKDSTNRVLMTCPHSLLEGHPSDDAVDELRMQFESDMECIVASFNEVFINEDIGEGC